jgi:tetratricopeptide (TPR) repeat protein
LREFFAKRGVTVGTSGLAVLISTNAILTTPAGLSAAIVVSVMSVGGMAALGLGAQLVALAGRFGLPGLAVGVLVLGIVTLVIWREAQSIDASQVALTTNLNTALSGTATKSPGKFTARAANKIENPIIAVPADTTQRDLALKLYHEGQTLQRETKQFEEALAKYNTAAAIIESGLPPENWMVGFYFTRATMNSDLPANLKRGNAAIIDDYTKALGIDPNYSSALANRALAYSGMKQYEAANADFTRLIEDPTVDYSHYMPGRTNGMAWAHEYRGRMWLDAHRPLEAIPDLQNALALYQKQSEKVYVQFYLAAAYKDSQQREQLVAEANSLSEQALKWATQRGGTDEERGAATSAMRWANEFLDYKASYQLEVAAAVHAKLGDFAEAVKYQERALGQLSPTAESQREAMQARLETYRARKSLVSP